MQDEPRHKSLSEHHLSSFKHKGETLINLTTGNSDVFKTKSQARRAFSKSWEQRAMSLDSGLSSYSAAGPTKQASNLYRSILKQKPNRYDSIRYEQRPLTNISEHERKIRPACDPRQVSQLIPVADQKQRRSKIPLKAKAIATLKTQEDGKERTYLNFYSATIQHEDARKPKTRNSKNVRMMNHSISLFAN